MPNRSKSRAAKATAARSHERSNSEDRPVRYLAVFADGRVSHRDARNGRAPWNQGTGWGRAGAHALPSDGPSAPAAKVKDPRKVAAGKARAAQAKAAGVKGKFTKAAPAPAPAPKAAKKAAPAKKAAGGARKGTGPKVKDESAGAMVVAAFRVTKDQKAKLDKLGNGEFVRRCIERASLPAGK